MKPSTLPKSDQFLRLWLAVMMIAGFLYPPVSQAIQYISDGTDGRGEGDPLDANDFGTGSGDIGGDIVHNNSAVIISDIGGVVILNPNFGSRLYLIVDFRSWVPAIQVFKVVNPVLQAEGPDAR